jgi:hypothetical protein
MCDCPQGSILCGGECVNPDIDPDNCGSCNNQCADAQLCGSGDCLCQPGLLECSGECINPDGDPDNCGGCNSPCGNDQVCVDGQCENDCGDLQQCGNNCSDLDSDPLNCGECGETCGNDQVCVEGNCEDADFAPNCNSCPCNQCQDGERCCDLGGQFGIACIDADECP